MHPKFTKKKEKKSISNSMLKILKASLNESLSGHFISKINNNEHESREKSEK